MNLLISSFLFVYFCYLFFPCYSLPLSPFTETNWLIRTPYKSATVTKTMDNTVLLSNGLISREFSLSPNWATIDYRDEHMSFSSIIRSIGPEAIVSFDNLPYNIGGFIFNATPAYYNKTQILKSARSATYDWTYVSHDTQKPEAPIPYEANRGVRDDLVWPPEGIRLNVHFKSPKYGPSILKNTNVTVHYELYNNMPVLVKWVSFVTDSLVGISIPAVETLHVNYEWIPQQGHVPATPDSETMSGPLYIETSEAHGTSVKWGLNEYQRSIHHGAHTLQVNVTYDPPLKKMTPSKGEKFTSFRVFELVSGTRDITQNTLGRKKMFRTLAPWTQESPLFFHVIEAESDLFRLTVDQLANVGFDIIVYSFGSGINCESNNTIFIDMVKKDVAYANSKGLEVGSYDLLVWTRLSKPEWMSIDPTTGKFRDSVCLASGYYDYVTEAIDKFFEKTGLTMIETDGPYMGFSCGAKNHSYHVGEYDSIYEQNRLQNFFYKRMRVRKAYINQPDNYFYHGGNKAGFHYDENQFSLPHWEDITISRQTMYLGLQYRIPTSLWMFLPITEYHAGGSAAYFEPLTKNFDAYRYILNQYMLYGVQAITRGYRIYDSAQTLQMVTQAVSTFKQYRDILTSDVVPVRYPDMHSVDAVLHVNAFLDPCGFLSVFNPTQNIIKNFELRVNLYYTGISKVAELREHDESKTTTYTLERNYDIKLNISMNPVSFTWFVIRNADGRSNEGFSINISRKESLKSHIQSCTKMFGMIGLLWNYSKFLECLENIE